jgi:hypothetical protein
MNSPVGMGGVLLVIAAVIWLMVFVPGWAKRGEIVDAVRNADQQLNLPNYQTFFERYQRLLDV